MAAFRRVDLQTKFVYTTAVGDGWNRLIGWRRIFTLLCLVLIDDLYGVQKSVAAPFAYVSNSYSNSVWVIDTGDATVAAVIAVGSGPTGVAVHPDGRSIYVANQNDSTISIIDAATKRITGTLHLPLVAVSFASEVHAVADATAHTLSLLESGLAPQSGGPTVTATSGPTPTPTPKRIGAEPFGVAINPSGDRLYVTTVGGLSIVDVHSGAVINSVPVPVAVDPVSRLRGIAICQHDARILVVVDNGYVMNGALVALDADGTVLSQTFIGVHPLAVAVSPDGNRAYVTNQLDNTVSVVDVTTAMIIATVPVAARPAGVAINAAGSHVYVASTGESGSTPGAVTVIDALRDEVETRIELDPGPFGVALSSDDQLLCVVSNGPDTMSIIDTASNVVVRTAGVGRGTQMLGQFIGPPSDPAATPTPVPTAAPRREMAYVTNRNSESVSVVDLAARREVATVSVPGRPWEIVAAPDGHTVYVGEVDTPRVVTISADTLTARASIPIDHGIFTMRADPDGRRVYVGGYQAISVIDAASESIVMRIPLEFGANSIALTPDGRQLLVTESLRLHFIDADQGGRPKTLSFASAPGNVGVTPDGAHVYVTGGAVLEGFTVINLESQSIETTIPLLFTPGAAGPVDFDFSPDGLSLYAVTHFIVYGPTASFFRSISIIDPDEHSFVDSIVPETDPERVAFSRETDFAYVTNSGANTVSEIDRHERRITYAIPVRSSPYGIAIAPAPNTTQLPTITVRPTRTSTPTPTLTPDLCPHAITLTPDHGPPGTLVVLRGSCNQLRAGFYASIGFGHIPIGQVRGGQDGTYMRSFVVPSIATVGTYDVSVYIGDEIGSASFTVVPIPPLCVGDCQHGGPVTSSAMLLGVGIALATTPASACDPFDVDHDGTVSVSELLAAVRGAISGCDSARLRSAASDQSLP